MPNDTTDPVLYSVRVNARRNAIYALIGGSILFMVLGWFAHAMQVPAAAFVILFIIAGGFMLMFLRQAIYGGEWVCTLTASQLRWSYPPSRAISPMNIEVSGVQSLVQVDSGSSFQTRSQSDVHWFIRTVDGDDYPIDPFHLGLPNRFVAKLRIANPHVSVIRERLTTSG